MSDKKYFKKYLPTEGISDKELRILINEDIKQKFKKYKELVQARKRKELINPKDPEVYHHNIYKK